LKISLKCAILDLIMKELDDILQKLAAMLASIKRLLPDKKTFYLILLALFGSFYVPWYMANLESRNTFVQNFSVLGQTRIYLSERLHFNIIGKQDPKVISDSLEDYRKSVNVWNYENLSNPIFIEYYYDHDMRLKFENELLPELTSLNDSLYELRKSGTTTENIPEKIRKIKDVFYNLNDQMIKCATFYKLLFRHCNKPSQKGF